MPFPLADWILDHPGMRHDLAQSGMKGQLRTALPLLRSVRPGKPPELRARLGRVLGVPAERVVLTTGATTANTLVLLYLARALRAEGKSSLFCGIRTPEYPPLVDIASGIGFRVSQGLGGNDVALLSNPNNPEGVLRTSEDVLRLAEGSRHVVIDETFREFTPSRSFARLGRAGWWTTGTFTKVYGADDIRMGFAVPPAGEAERFRDACDLWVDRPALASVGAALSILRNRTTLLRESRALFERNLRLLRERVPDLPLLRAPVWFDRAVGPDFTLRLAEEGIRRGVLVCPGHYFGDPSGVRVCLTQRTFEKDLDAYLALRARFVSRGRAGR
ncbi:MAG: aminotransferase class I/II-fold pyridoxal phosphate-dependent enzyme [Euryarchaeota archaeon]|nr:aminotransferase class I/II-fold pyridoxal phosphate-dependent enzyme [Euryarchaeota archaeon]MDE1880665.1 aminotransferase class I/II-fold pyridoxal phosphate-dependent enzyme [Euryarchaeota archaeon]MDE2044833.1 aminotransferase class I/II-fold pyridoxal phosphate-dependent enzyme [Thermoplasmata archaeon]